MGWFINTKKEVLIGKRTFKWNWVWEKKAGGVRQI